MATIHALQRAAERLGVELDPDVVQGIVHNADNVAASCGDIDTAARVYRLGRMVGQAWSDRSNGDTVVAIIRQGEVRTFMFRRSTQPHTPEAYNVRKVRG
jgi:hypothetical protein